MDIVNEAKELKQEEDRKRRLLKLLDIYEDEMSVQKELRQAKQNFNHAVIEYLEEAT